MATEAHDVGREELDELLAYDKPYCVTIYAQCIDPNNTTNPNGIELKNILREAERTLIAAGVTAQETAKTLAPARQLLREPEFRGMQAGSYALFLHADMFRYYHIRHLEEPYTPTVGTGFNLEPLLKSLDGNQPYYLLVLGHKHVRLYDGDHYRLQPVELKRFPTDVKQALHIDEYPKVRETHTIAPASEGKGSEAVHGQYNVAQTDKDMLLQFFRRIDRRLHRLLIKDRRPLVLAGVNYLLPIYRRANTYPGLLGKAITGNQDRMDPAVIREKAWQLVRQQQPG